ncbi:MAG: type VI secretion system contractile sheath small subunit [Candidatus Paracaedibacteraceae bacterium]|nr:type VI secretion system contractile sheath small subunit [Candidatus Paracaedibacteraceae bacterium]
MESIQHVLDRVRKPRVHITYDVEIGDAIEMKELPFVMGIMADLAGNRTSELPKLKDRKFVELDPDSFGEIMASIAPRIAFDVPSRMPEAADGDTISVALDFKSMDDFNPLQIAQRMNGLSELCASRVALSDLLAKLDGNDVLHAILKDVMSDPDKLAQLKKDLEAAAPADPKA